jgi:putative Mg2+ transporter-C (MgtC) family protein
MESPADFIALLPPFLVRGAFAILCGALIGFERERKGKPAGLRTNTLICLGATLYMLASEFLLQKLGAPNTDPTRIAAQIVTGIGFLGAGTIIQSRGEVIGLTSAATIWVVAAIGLLIGAGFPLLGTLCTALVLLTLIGFEKIEPRILGKCHFIPCEITFTDDGGRTRAELARVLADHNLDIGSYPVEAVPPNLSRLTFQYCDRHPSHSRYLNDLWSAPGVLDIRWKR